MTNGQKLKEIRTLAKKYEDDDWTGHDLAMSILKILDTPTSAVKKTEFTEQDTAYKWSVYLFNLIRQRRKNYKRPDFQSWSKDMDKINRIDKRSWEEINKVLRWAQQDTFWQNNILSPDKLRKQFDRLALLMQQDKGWNAKQTLVERTEKSGPTLRDQLRKQHGND